MSVTDKEFNLVDRRVKAFTRKWHSSGLGWWRLQFSVVRSSEDMPTTGNKEEADPLWQCVASTHVAWQYRDAKITVNADAAKEMKEERFESTLLHELGHVIVNELRSIAKPDGLADNWLEHEEHVCTTIGQMLGWTYQSGLDAGKKEAKRKPTHREVLRKRLDEVLRPKRKKRGPRW